jgi:hypothetical protein
VMRKTYELIGMWILDHILYFLNLVSRIYEMVNFDFGDNQCENITNCSICTVCTQYIGLYMIMLKICLMYSIQCVLNKL